MSDEDRTRRDSAPRQDSAELAERDRAQPNLVTQQANRRADEDAESDRDERADLVDEVEDDAQG